MPPPPPHVPVRARSSRSSSRRRARIGLVARAALILAGLALIQSAWVLAVDPFRAIDEFDHAQRADAVASGQWLAPDTGVVSVDPRLNQAVTPVCLSRPRQTDGTCPADRTQLGGSRYVSSTAAAYNPVYYFVIGTVSQPFSGDGYLQLYAMRAASALLTGALLAAALTLLLTAFTSRWPFVMALASIAPMAAYTSMVVAPNGLEIAAGIALWSALLGVRFGDLDRGRRHAPWVLAGSAAVLLGLLRTLGPLWLVCIVAAVLVASRGDRSWARERPALVVTALATASSVAGVGWALVAGTNQIKDVSPVASAATASVATSRDDGAARLSELPLQMLVWLLQTVGAIPYRDEQLPGAVYVTVLVLWLVLVAVSTRQASASLKWSIGAVGLVSFTVPIAISAATREAGWLWQGRYAWPLLVGLLLLAGVAGAAKGQLRSGRTAAVVVAVTAGLMALVNVVALLDVVSRESQTSPLAEDPQVPHVPVAVLATLLVLGFACLAGAASRARRSPDDGPGPSPHDLSASAPVDEVLPPSPL